MTGAKNCGGGRRTRLKQLCVYWGHPPPIYKGGRTERAGLGLRQGRRWSPNRTPLQGWRPLPPILLLLGVGEEGGRGKEGGCPPTPSPIRTSKGGAPAPLWAGVPPLQGPCGPYSSPRGSGNPSGTPIIFRNLPESSGIQIPSSNISFFTSRTFRDSSSCP